MWIAAEPGLQPEVKPREGEGEGKSGEGEREGEGTGKEKRATMRGKDLGGIRTIAIRSVEAGEFVLEVWVEEGRGKMDALEDLEKEEG